MNSDTALADIMSLLNVTTPAGAVDAVRSLLDAAATKPVVAIDAGGGMTIAQGATVGLVLRLLATATARVEGIVISA